MFVDLQDAGIGPDCTNRLIVCSERINPVLRVRLADAGYPLPPARKYARVVRQAFSCPNPDGGTRELIVPGFEQYSPGNDSPQIPEPERCIDRPCTDLAGFCGNGPKNVALASGIAGFGTPPCVRAPLDGGLACQRLGALADGGTAFFGRGNVFPVDAGTGAQCEPVECAVFFGDNPDVSL
jgi:hypothetical protein